jgi:hypothetical protein
MQANDASKNETLTGNAKMITNKEVILTAIHCKGSQQVKAEAAKLADDLLCSVGYVLQIVRKVEKGEIKIATR